MSTKETAEFMLKMKMQLNSHIEQSGKILKEVFSLVDNSKIDFLHTC